MVYNYRVTHTELCSLLYKIAIDITSTGQMAERSKARDSRTSILLVDYNA